MPVIKILSWATLAFIIATAFTPLFTTFAYRWKLGKRIRIAKETPVFAGLHEKKAGTPTMGGVLIWGTTLIVALLSWLLSYDNFFLSFNFVTRSQTYLPLGAMLSAALVGIIDDLLNIYAIGAHGGGMRVRYRLLFYLIVAFVCSWWFYAKLDWNIVHFPFYGDWSMGAWAILFFILVIVATAFSVNETDGLDGLAGGVMLICLASYAAIAYTQGKYDLATLLAVIIGSLLSFLWFNIPPARFFMGDTGSMSLGVVLGVVAILTNSVFLLPIIGIVLVVESLSVIIQVTSKKIRGKKVFISAPFHHHLEAIGWEEPKIVMRLWVVSLVAAALGLIIALADPTLFHL